MACCYVQCASTHLTSGNCSQKLILSEQLNLFLLENSIKNTSSTSNSLDKQVFLRDILSTIICLIESILSECNSLQLQLHQDLISWIILVTVLGQNNFVTIAACTVIQ